MDTTTDTPASPPSSTNGAATHDGPRLEPIENPDSWKTWLAYRLAKWMMGAVITPLKVVQARFPESLRLGFEMNKLEERLTLDDALRIRLKRRVAALNGCSFCTDMVDAQAQDADGIAPGASEEPRSERVQAALDYATAVTEDVDVDDDTFERLRSYFSEREIVEITWLCATENYYNRMAVPLGIGSDGLCTVEPE